MRALLMTGKKKEWQPGANTLCYLPIDNNDTTSIIYDHSGNGNDFSCTNCSFQTSPRGKKVLHLFNGRLSKSGAIFSSENLTVNIWTYGCTNLFSQMDVAGFNYGIEIYKDSAVLFQRSTVANINWTSIENSWYNICVTINSSNNQKVYINGVQVGSSSENPRWSSMSGVTTYLGYSRNHSQNSTGYMGAVILETGNWTEQQVLDYYNLTKSNYI